MNDVVATVVNVEVFNVVSVLLLVPAWSTNASIRSANIAVLVTSEVPDALADKY